MSQPLEMPVSETVAADRPSRGGQTQRLSYVPFVGCMISAKYPQMEAAARKTLEGLGVELVDIDGFSCCPDPVYFKAMDKMAWLTVAARNLCLAEEAGRDIVTMCTGCTSTLREANHLLKQDAELRARVNTRLRRAGREYAGTISVRHIATVLRDDVGLERVAESVTRPLSDLKVAIHYGCHLLKPSEIMGVDDPDRPTIMENLIALTGAAPTRHALHLACCGKACMDDKMPGEMMSDLFGAAKTSGADCLCLICPTCFDQLELGEIKLSRSLDDKIDLPIVYYFQLLGLAQGLTPAEVGLQYHRIKPDALLAGTP